MTDTLLSVQNLKVSIGYADKHRLILNGVDLSIAPGEIVGLAGQSGSGKTIFALSLLRLNPGRILHESNVHYRGEELLALSQHDMQRRIRGREIAMIFQDARASLNPVRPVGKQLIDVLRHRRNLSKTQAHEEARRLLDQVGIPLNRFGDYAHQFSGGQAQRVAIARAIACKPSLLLADEPTSALDTVTQRIVVDLLIRLRDELDMALLFISHSLLLLSSGLCDRIVVLHEGRVVEEGDARRILEAPQHPYTIRLKASIPGSSALLSPSFENSNLENKHNEVI